MKFWKMNGAGNDFIIINNMEEKLSVEEMGPLAFKLCERHMSLGADGFMVVDAPEGDADFKMRFFNADGSMGEMCGNGARCICRYGYENGLSDDIPRIETTAGVVTGERITDKMYKVRLNDPSVCELDYPIEVDGKTYECAYVELGNPGIPHAAVPMKNLAAIPQPELFELGRKMRYNERFPKGANVNFYEIIGEDLVYERTWERGVEDFTYACGTGTGSVVTVLTRKGLVSGKNVRVGMRGGELIIDALEKDLFLTGPTLIVAKGEIDPEALA